MILLPLGLAFALQAGEAPRKRPPAFVRDSSVADSAKRDAPRRLAVTAQVLATAFRDEGAKELFYRARAARIAQDSTLRSYDATVRARMSVGLGFGKIGRERVLFRQESASRVRWQHGVGAHIELTGARLALPIAPAKEERNELLDGLASGAMSPIPYFPGYESLWIGGRAETDVDERRLVNPLAEGAEAYYTYQSGDSVRYTLPDGTAMQVRELRVRPRSPKWNLAVGSLTFDVVSGQLVQAAYRLAAPVDVWTNASANRDSNASTVGLAIVKAVLPTIRNEISEVAIEYSLHQGRFWLPRSRLMRGVTEASLVRMPVTIEHSYRFNTVNAGEPLPAIVVAAPSPYGPLRTPDSLSGDAARQWRDSAMKARSIAREALRDSVGAGPCDGSGTRTISRTRYDGHLAIAVTVPCDVNKLVTSADFTTSIYEADEEAFGSSERDALVARALALGAQAPFGRLLPAPRTQYGLSMTRYNRVEGLSTGILVEQQLGSGYLATALARIGSADREPNAELSLARTNLSRTYTLTGYNRLVSASDWGTPLTFGASLSALLFGRDEGFYYRASGVELGFATQRGVQLDWRLFAERHRNAAQETSFSVGGTFAPNILAAAGTSTGAAVRFLDSRGVDPRGFRLFSDVRLEAATGDSTYGRGAMEFTLSRGLPGDLAAAVTVAGGSSLGPVPSQRRWYLGGTHTVRGQSADTASSGNAFWLARTEVGREFRSLRLSTFGDLGWVGDRTRISEVGRPMSGAGVGVSMLDGLVRFDVARGLYPAKQFRFDLYIGGRW